MNKIVMNYCSTLDVQWLDDDRQAHQWKYLMTNDGPVSIEFHVGVVFFWWPPKNNSGHPITGLNVTLGILESLVLE